MSGVHDKEVESASALLNSDDKTEVEFTGTWSTFQWEETTELELQRVRHVECRGIIVTAEDDMILTLESDGQPTSLSLPAIETMDFHVTPTDDPSQVSNKFTWVFKSKSGVESEQQKEERAEHEEDEDVINPWHHIEAEVRNMSADQLRYVIFTAWIGMPLLGDRLRHVAERSDLTEVLPGLLYVGSFCSAINRETLKKHNISHILNVAIELPNVFEQPTSTGSHDPIVYKKISLRDDVDEDITKVFQEACDFIEQARAQGTACLVHCYAGHNRSVTLVVSYLLKFKHMRLDEAVRVLKHKRQDALTNSAFVRQLANYEKSLYGDSTVDLESYQIENLQKCLFWLPVSREMIAEALREVHYDDTLAVQVVLEKLENANSPDNSHSSSGPVMGMPHM
eukprot:GILJ01004820.1.p1 GENE.GILJ01004820.1~~GILJ01004820.1.p1  ORF type:complete len:410 (+),score=60.53 GILJ01004820.1:44-1231(+)